MEENVAEALSATERLKLANMTAGSVGNLPVAEALSATERLKHYGAGAVSVDTLTWQRH